MVVPGMDGSHRRDHESFRDGARDFCSVVKPLKIGARHAGGGYAQDQLASHFRLPVSRLPKNHRRFENAFLLFTARRRGL
jgi:hypothetical protein